MEDGSEGTGEKVEGLHSWEATIGTVTQTSKSGPGWSGPFKGSPSEGRSFRIDLERVDGVVRALVATPWLASKRAEAPLAGNELKLTAGDDVSWLAMFSSSTGNTTDVWNSLTIRFDASGRPVDGTLEGDSTTSSGDVMWGGTVTATITFGADRNAPTFRTQSPATFAPVALPWDRQLLEASEPFADDVELGQLVGRDVAPRFVAEKDVQATLSGTAVRAFTLTPKDWDLRFPLTVTTPPARDLAGNVAANAGTMSLTAASLVRTGTRTMRVGRDAGAAFTWGGPTMASDCGTGRSCLAFTVKTGSYYCPHGSLGGLALRMPGGGKSVRLNQRVVGKREDSYGPMGFNAPMSYLQAAVPGGPIVERSNEVSVDPSASSFDTGWTKITLAAPLGSETGVALSIGGKGPKTSCMWGPPVPDNWTVTVYVDEIAIE